jgi:uncharacterized Zn finger protein (UPF0148 family)
MSDTIDCEECGHDLFELEGEYHCPACDSISGFELTPDQKDEFAL